MAEREYRKLAGRGQRKGEPFTWYTLWLGRDHLLQVEHSGYSEDYKRFYFADIQSISLCRTNRARNWMLSFLGMLAVGATIAVTLGVPPNNDAATIWLSGSSALMALSLLLLLINAVKGPACACFIQTAVQKEQLASLKRIKKARKVIARLRELIAATQGLLPPEEARARFAAGQPPPSSAPAPAATPPPSSPETTAPPPAS